MIPRPQGTVPEADGGTLDKGFRCAMETPGHMPEVNPRKMPEEIPLMLD